MQGAVNRYNIVKTGNVDAYPLTPTQLAAWLRIADYDTESDILQICIDTAVDTIQRETCYILNKQTYKFTIDNFPYHILNRNYPYDYKNGAIRFPYNPVFSVTSFKYYDNDNVQQTYTSYVLDVNSLPARIAPPRGEVFPFADYYGLSPIEIVYVAGFASGSIPVIAQHAVRVLAGHIYENREATTEKVLNTVPLSLKRYMQQLKYSNFV